VERGKIGREEKGRKGGKVAAFYISSSWRKEWKTQRKIGKSALLLSFLGGGG